MVYKYIIISSLLLVSLFVTQQAQAHLGGGPPFLKINGVDAQTNPYNQGSATILSISWDTAPASYVIHKPITFEINVPELMKATTVPAEYAKDIKIRWSYAKGDNFEKKEPLVEEGSKLTKTFTSPGSYLVIIEAKLPADSDYILINSVQIDVKPSEDYQLPFASVFAGTQSDDPNKNILLVSDGSYDPSVKLHKYLWDFGDGRLRAEQSVNRKFERVATIGVETVFHRVVDDNGFSSDVGFYVQKINGKIQFTPFANQRNLPVTIGTYEQAQERTLKPGKFIVSLPVFFGIVLVVMVLTGGSWWWMLKKK